MSTLIGRLLVGTRLDPSGFQKGAKKSNKALSSFEKRTKSISRGITRSMAAMGAAFAIGSIIQNTAKTIGDFDQKVANLAATSGRSRNDIGALIQNAKDVGAISAFSATQVLDLQTELAKLGNTESEIISMTKAVGDFSIAVGATTSEAATLTGGVLKSFGKTAQETESVVSSLAVATTKSALDFQKLNTALPLVGTAAEQSGVSLNRTVALLGVLSDRNIDASTSGTALRNIFLELKNKGLTYEEAMSKINNSTDSLNEANKLFGKRGAVVATVLAQSSGQADILEKSITGVDGALKKMTDERLNTLQGKFTLAKSAWEGFILSVEKGDGVISNAIKQTTEAFTGVLTGLTALNQGASFEQFMIAVYGSDEERGAVLKDLKEANKIQKEIADGTRLGNGGYRSQRGGGLGRLRDKKIGDDPLSKEIEKLNKGLNETGEKTAKIVTLSGEISNLEKEVSLLSESYIKGGSKDGNIIDSITGKQAKIIELNKELSQSAELLQRLKEGIAPGGSRETIAAPESLPNKSTGIISEVFSDSSIDTANKLGKEIKTVAENIKETNAAAEESKSRFDNLADVINTGVSDSLVGLGENLGAALAHANSFGEGITNVFKGALDSLLGVLISVGKLAISTGITVDAIKTALKSLSGTAAIIGGVALVALATAVRSKLSGSVPQLAGGGVIDQPTFAMLGEYPGAANNPEIAAPESKLRNIFSGELAKMGNVGNASSKVFGNDIYLANKRAKTYIGRTG